MHSARPRRTCRKPQGSAFSSTEPTVVVPPVKRPTILLAISGMRLSIVVLGLLAACSDSLPQCEDTESFSNFVPTGLGGFCSIDFVACNECPEDSSCEPAVQGASFVEDQGLCTKPCETDSDCADIDFEANNQNASELAATITCEDVATGRFCRAALVTENQGSSGGGCNDACLDTCTVGISCLDICCS